MIPLPSDFSAFLRLLNEHGVKYLLIEGYAVGYHGYVRETADLDVWVEPTRKNAERVVAAVHAFGFDVPSLRPEMFLREDKVVRMGVPPMRIEMLTSISGVDFERCYTERVSAEWGDLTVNVISADMLKRNKRASDRMKDRVDLEHLV